MLRAVVHKSPQVLFLGLGLMLTKYAISTPTLMAPLAPSIIAGILAPAILLALIMDQGKAWLFAQFKMA